jgi:hypothetical protein
MRVSRITKIAGITLVGFCAASVVADKVNLNPLNSQMAGFVGAFLGTLIGRRRVKPETSSEIQAAVTAGKDQDRGS